MISATADTGDARESLAAMAGQVRAALIDATQTLADELIATAQARLPSGPLADSIEMTEIEGSRARIGSPLPYAAIQEFGFAGTEQVRESLRLQSLAFGRPIAPREALVRAHERTVDLPGKFYLSGALDEMQDEIEAAYREAVDQALGASERSN